MSEASNSTWAGLFLGKPRLKRVRDPLLGFPSGETFTQLSSYDIINIFIFDQSSATAKGPLKDKRHFYQINGPTFLIFSFTPAASPEPWRFSYFLTFLLSRSVPAVCPNYSKPHCLKVLSVAFRTCTSTMIQTRLVYSKVMYINNLQRMLAGRWASREVEGI